MKAEKGFTLVEILIVVVILGILAAIVIPQFTSASVDAKESLLMPRNRHWSVTFRRCVRRLSCTRFTTTTTCLDLRLVLILKRR
ncbi:MAG: type IV pilin protein [Planctomycetota bacterium]